MLQILIQSYTISLTERVKCPDSHLDYKFLEGSTMSHFYLINFQSASYITKHNMAS